MARQTGLYQARTLELRGRKHQEADHAHFIVALRFYDTRDAIKPALSEGTLFSPPLLLGTGKQFNKNFLTKQRIMAIVVRI